MIPAFFLRLIEREGPFSNDPSDSGGATCWGITRSTLAAWREKAVTVEDVAHLSQEEAALIYKNLYLSRPRIDQLPSDLIEPLLDFAVNSGPALAVKALQECLHIKADGVVGPGTIAASFAAGPSLKVDLIKWRVMMFARIVRRDPSQVKFLGGWLSRALLFL